MKNKVFSLANQVLLAVILLFLPLIFFPFLTDSFELGKQVFLLGSCFLVFVLWALQSLGDKKLVYKKTRYLPSVGLFLLAFVLSTLINSSYKIQSLTANVGVGAVFLAGLSYWLLNSLAKRKWCLYGLLAGGILTALLRLILFSGNFSFPLNFPSWNLSLTQAWSPTGSLIAQAVFLLVLIPLGFSLMYESLRQQKLLSASALFLANTLNLIGLGLSVHLLLTSAQPILLPQGTAWAIALEGLKNGRFAAFGLGPGQFVNAFTAFKSLTFNTSDYWNLRFGSSSNWYYQLLTEVGLVGLLAYLFLAWIIFKDAIKVFRQPRLSFIGLSIYLSLVILLIIQFFIPLNFFLLALFFVLLGLARDEEQVNINLSSLDNFIFLALIPPIAFWIALLFLGGKVALANYYFLQSLKAASQNDGVKTYNFQIKAIQANPSVVNYRLAYSQTNFALANSLASNPPSGQLTDQDRNTITQLIQQSLREAKAAAALDRFNAAAWENLANIYRNLINFAEGADQWALASYQQAINLDPLNPRLRVDLGGLYYSQQNWQQAANLFSQAVNLKSDWANAHYNLANVLREAGDLAGAKQEYEITQSLVQIDTNDYAKVSQELEEVKKRLPTPTPSKKAVAPETLVTPAPPVEGIEPPLELPEEGPEMNQ